MSGTLILARHHESEWNKQGRWTGSRDVHLTPYGLAKSKEMGELLRDTHIDRAFASVQVRSLETLNAMLETLNLSVPIERSANLNERDYGIYTGMNKWEVQQKLGKEKWDHIRRDWDCPIPEGETLKMVYERAVPYFKEHILPLVNEGKNVLVVSHGNALRALMIYIEEIAPEDAAHLEMLFGGVVWYTLTPEGHMLHKEVQHVSSSVNA